ncbi:MAG: hypothetical protein AB1640_10880 [bacterium]
MTGKDYVQEAIDKAEKVLSGVRTSGKLDGQTVLEGLAKACSDLGQVKNRATLKTRAGVNLALPIFEAGQNLDDSWEEAQSGDGLEDLEERMEEFVMAADVLVGALKERTVVMT